MIEVKLLKGGYEVRFDCSSIAELGEHRWDAGRRGGRNIWTVKGLEVQTVKGPEVQAVELKDGQP